LLVKLKCNRDHICGLNWVTSYWSKDLKYTTWSSVFFAYMNLTRRGLPLQDVCQVDIMCKRQLKHYRQLLDEKSLFSSMQGTFHSFKGHKWRRRPYWVKSMKEGQHYISLTVKDVSCAHLLFLFFYTNWTPLHGLEGSVNSQTTPCAHLQCTCWKRWWWWVLQSAGVGASKPPLSLHSNQHDYWSNVSLTGRFLIIGSMIPLAISCK
jgi:hypothetical protein